MKSVLDTKRLRRIFNTRKVHTLKRGVGSIWGFECSKFGESERESILVEKSLRTNCKTILTRSGRTWKDVYDLFQDLSSIEEVNLTDHQIVHRLDYSTAKTGLVPSESYLQSERSIWFAELKDIASRCRRMQPISLVTVPSSAIHAHLLQDGLDSATGRDKAKAYICGLRSSLLEVFPSGIGLGVDFTTEHLSTLSATDLAQFMDFLTAEAQVAPPLKTVDAALIATNIITSEHARRLSSAANTVGIRTIATEVLRIHSRKIGLLSEPQQDLLSKIAIKQSNLKITKALTEKERLKPKITRQMLEDLRQGRGTESASQLVAAQHSATPVAASEEESSDHSLVIDCTKDLKTALDNCLYLEKGFMETIYPTIGSGIEVNKICWAHNISHILGSISSLEEWSYLKRTQVEPNIKAAISLLQKHGSESDEWVKTYSPSIHSVLTSCDALFLAKKLQITKECQEALQSSAGATPSSSNLSSYMGALALAVGNQQVALADTQWRDFDEEEAVADLLATSNSSSALAAWTSIRDVVASYSD